MIRFDSGDKIRQDALMPEEEPETPVSAAKEAWS